MWRRTDPKPQDKIRVLCEEGDGWFFDRGKVYDGYWRREVNDEGKERVRKVFGVVDNYGECYIYPNKNFTIIEGYETPQE